MEAFFEAFSALLADPQRALSLLGLAAGAEGTAESVAAAVADGAAEPAVADDAGRAADVASSPHAARVIRETQIRTVDVP